MHIKPSMQEAAGYFCARFWQDNPMLRHRLGEAPDVFLDFVRGAIEFAATEGVDRILTPQFRERWKDKITPVKSK